MNFMTQKILPILISRDWEIAHMKEYALSCFYVIIVNKKNLEGNYNMQCYIGITICILCI